MYNFIKNIPFRSKIKFAIVSLIYILVVVWIGNYWLLLGLPVIFDAYITKKIPWNFWKRKKKSGKTPAWIEWIDALIFALIAVYIINIFLFQNYKIPTSSMEKSLLVGDHLFVSKVSYGPRMPITPLSFPLVQNRFPIINAKSYFEWPQWNYKRLKGLSEIEHNDIVVFNFPAGDTVPVYRPNPDYYTTIMEIGKRQVNQNPSILGDKSFDSEYERRMFINDLGRKVVNNNPGQFGKVVSHPVDRRDNYVKRCVALPGDTFEIRSNQIYINDVAQENPESVQHNYHLITDGTMLGKRFFNRLNISDADRRQAGVGPHYILPFTKEMIETVKKYDFVKSLEIDEQKSDKSGLRVFPHSRNYPWNRDNYGPLWIPKSGETVELSLDNLLLYERIITAYEGNTLEVKNKTIYINGKPTNNYTFEMDYYFMIGDNRHKSADSRHWGFVPEDHIIGRPILTWLSLDADKSFPSNIRWGRFFKSARE